MEQCLQCIIKGDCKFFGLLFLEVCPFDEEADEFEKEMKEVGRDLWAPL